MIIKELSNQFIKIDQILNILNYHVDSLISEPEFKNLLFTYQLLDGLVINIWDYGSVFSWDKPFEIFQIFVFLRELNWNI